MKRIFAAALVAVGLTMTGMSASAMTPVPMDSRAVIGSDTIQVRGGHGHGHMHRGGRGHHYGWNRGRGHHYGWSRGRHHGWARTIAGNRYLAAWSIDLDYAAPEIRRRA